MQDGRGVVHSNESCDPTIHFQAIKLARACRNVVRGILREEEVIEVDREFYTLIRPVLESITCNGQEP